MVYCMVYGMVYRGRKRSPVWDLVVFVCACKYFFIKSRITTQSGPVVLMSLTYYITAFGPPMGPMGGGVNDCFLSCICVCVCI